MQTTAQCHLWVLCPWSAASEQQKGDVCWRWPRLLRYKHTVSDGSSHRYCLFPLRVAGLGVPLPTGYTHLTAACLASSWKVRFLTLKEWECLFCQERDEWKQLEQRSQQKKEQKTVPCCHNYHMNGNRLLVVPRAQLNFNAWCVHKLEKCCICYTC